MAVLYTDVYGSIERRRKQEEKDAAQAAQPIWFHKGFLDMVSIEARVQRWNHKQRDDADRAVRKARRLLNDQRRRRLKRRYG